MAKRWFDFWSDNNGSAWTGERRNGSAGQGVALLELPESTSIPTAPPLCDSAPSGNMPPSDERADFEHIYGRAAEKRLRLPHGILKVVDMLSSAHLSTLTPDAKRCAVAMALESVGAEVEDLLQDAVVRQRLLGDYEREQEEKLRDFEELKADENRKLQAELDRLTSDYMAKVQANLDEVAREQDEFRAWQRKKQKEVQRIAEAAAFCVPEELGAQAAGSLRATLERACAVRRERL